ncbi:MAG TPA: aquaporin [Stellaceae bacterium]|nr:aquaporin [Stellaceae bacterium]
MTVDAKANGETLVAPSTRASARARLAAIEFVATGFLLIAVVGSGIMAERLAGGNTALALLANAIATGGALLALILAFEPASGAHMNPYVTLAAVALDGFDRRLAAIYIAAQVTGAIAGVWIVHLMFGMPVLEMGTKMRTGGGEWLGEAVATFGLLATIWGCRARQAPVTAFAVAAFITGAYWFTSSTAFANPAVTLARALTDSFAGIRPQDVPGFMLGQIAGFAAALPLCRVLTQRRIS